VHHVIGVQVVEQRCAVLVGVHRELAAEIGDHVEVALSPRRRDGWDPDAVTIALQDAVLAHIEHEAQTRWQ